MLNRWIDLYCRALGALMVLCLTLMVLMVFTNVVLRYAFNSGINVSEELSRWLFVWMTFMGAVVALRQRGHLGTDMLVARLSVRGKRAVLGLAYVLMLFCCWLVLQGSWEQTQINLGTTSAVLEVPTAWLYGSGLVFSISAIVILVHSLWRLVSGQMPDEELVGFKESEESAHSPA
jgi:TRAP-type C4-dicarboxylate transport system permease small subunit